MLKDEPEDLTHLAPTAGDVDVPLETNYFLSDMFDDLLCDTYCPLLTEDLNTLSDSQSSHTSSKKDEGSNSNDPFFSYRDETSSSGGSPSSRLHSPALSKVPVYISANAQGIFNKAARNSSVLSAQSSILCLCAVT